MLNANKSCLGVATSKSVRKRIEAHVWWFETELCRTDRVLDKAIEGDGGP